MNGHGAPLLGRGSHGGEGNRDIASVGAQEAIWVLNAGFAGGHGKVGVQIVFILVLHDIESFQQIDSIVENGRRGQVGEEVAWGVWYMC